MRISAVLSKTIYMPAIAGIMVFKKIDTSFHPFLFYIWVGTVNETLSTEIINRGGQTNLNTNIYVIIASVLLVWFFRKQGVIRSRIFYILILASLGIVWLLEHFIFGWITDFTTWFRTYWSFLVVLLGINALNLVLLKRVNLFRDSLFLISMALVIFYIYKSIVQAFGIYGLVASAEFNETIYLILMYLNALTNLVYVPAILWIPRKKPSLFQP